MKSGKIFVNSQQQQARRRRSYSTHRICADLIKLLKRIRLDHCLAWLSRAPEPQEPERDGRDDPRFDAFFTDDNLSRIHTAREHVTKMQTPVMLSAFTSHRK